MLTDKCSNYCADRPRVANRSNERSSSFGRIFEIGAIPAARIVSGPIDLDDVRSNGYAFQIEMSFRAWRRGFRIVEIPIVFVDRTEGESKMSKRIVREAIWMVWRLRWWAVIGRV